MVRIISVFALVCVGYLIANVKSEPTALALPPVVAAPSDIVIPEQSQCTIDPVTGQRTCTPVRNVAKAAVSVAGKAVERVGQAMQPADVVSYGSSGTSYTQSVVSSDGYSSVGSSSVSYGSTGTSYATSYQPVRSFVASQPVRSTLRRLLRR